MHYLAPTFALILAACGSLVWAQSKPDEPIAPFIELQSGPLTPGLELDESPRPIHQIRLLVDANQTRGTLVLDGNDPKFDEFGALVGGIPTPQVRDTSDPRLAVQLACTIEFVKDGPEMWRLYRLSGPKIRTPLRIASRGSLGDSGPTRLVVLGPDDNAKSVVECTRYGLVVP
jgi:hypothetical protein